MANVLVAGVGMHPTGRFPDKSYRDIAAVAAVAAVEDAGLSWEQIGVMFASHTRQGISAGQQVAHDLGLAGIPVVNVENACASGTTAIHEAATWIEAGRVDVALVVGFEKMPKGVISGLGEAGSYEDRMGLNVMPSLYGFMAQKHMHRYGTTARQMALVSVKNHQNGVLNPYAQYRKVVTVEEVLHSRMVADPLTLLQCCPTSDGAAAVLLINESTVSLPNPRRAVWWAGSAVGTMCFDSDESEVSRRTAYAAYEAAAIGPEDIELVECHDAFTIGEILHYEELGLCPEGEGGRFIEEGHTWLNGKVPVNPSGGLQSRGHPLGMTGVAQVYEAVVQMRGEAGDRQVPHWPKTAVTHTQGYAGVSAVGVLHR